ncbi:indole-3-acetamide hydrolase [Thelonectria olida]|uniref:Indole-3-acetamide hydrolase n=1 Tax=Thelonectria olida TaxID=1576542 RepID=A0A9P8WFT6_9HYPO|nr:indole-3-acetamide hydrolase [Thelonectria olida]
MQNLQACLSAVTRDKLENIVERYLAEDDVFAAGFLNKVIVTSQSPGFIDIASIDDLQQSDLDIIHLNTEGYYAQGSSSSSDSTLPPGPLYAIANGTSLQLSKVYRLYEDSYRTFVGGVYESNGRQKSLNYFEPHWGYPMIPVPSRLYSIGDQRPLAGKRIGVKDIYDIEGIKTTRGSRAYSQVYGPANATASSIRRIIDLGGAVVGKQKTAQFASAAHAWEWTDAYYPQNPRGDGFLSCSASSSGGGCSIAAYDWLDVAIGSDTGQSVRQPAAFSGTYDNRPSQGLMALDCVMPIAYGTDTAGFFSRHPEEWIAFAKAWYDPSFYQDQSLNRLPELSVPDERTFPKRILYPVDHLPLPNGAAEEILQQFLKDVANLLDATVENFNLTETVEKATERSLPDILRDLDVLWYHDLRKDVAMPLLEKYKPGFPPLDKPFRDSFRKFAFNDAQYEAALQNRSRDAELWHEKVLYQTDESCSESIFIYDIGTGGLPSFREKELNQSPGAALPAACRTAGAAPIISSYFGDVDITIPIDQVAYFSNVTYEEVLMPVTVNLVARRGCDFVLFNLVGELAKKGIVKPVLTGRQAYAS